MKNENEYGNDDSNTSIFICRSTQAFTHACTYTHMRARARTHTYTHTHTHARTHTHTHTHTSTQNKHPPDMYVLDAVNVVMFCFWCNYF